MSGKAIHWNPELEHYLRDQFELPPVTDDELQELIQKDASKPTENDSDASI